MPDHLEIELKLEIEPGDRERLKAMPLVGGMDGHTARLISTYFDTPGEDLRKAGYWLRVRRSGTQSIQTVKATGSAPAGLFVRREWDQPLTGEEPLLDEAGGPLAQALPPEARERIAPIFVTDVTRTTRQIDGGGALVELAIDEGEVRAGSRREALSEVELELRSGPPQALFDVARGLSHQVPLRLGVWSKAERGYALAASKPDRAFKAEPVLLDPEGSAADALRTIAQACLRQFRLNESLLMRSGSPEPIHQARVGLRRLRSALSIYKPAIADDDRTRALRIGLRELAGTLGRVRDIDVLMPRIEGEAHERLAAAREERLGALRADLDALRTRLLMIDLAEWFATGGFRPGPGASSRLEEKVAVFARDLLDKRFKRVRRRGKGFGRLDDEARHDLRIEAKKLRYATEFFASLFTGKEERGAQKRFLSALEELQDVLGDLNDLAHGPHVLATLGIDMPPPKAARADRERLLAKAERAYRDLVEAERFWRI